MSNHTAALFEPAPGLASVAVGRPVRGAFTYRIPPELQGRLQPGHRLEVPFGNSRELGVYLGPAPEAPPAGRLKAITRLLDDAPIIPEDVLTLVRFAASHYRYPLGEAIQSILPPGLNVPEAVPPIPDEVVLIAEALVDQVPELGRAPAQAATLGYLLAIGGQAPVAEVAHAVPGAREHLKRLHAKGFVRLLEVEKLKGSRPELTAGRPETLTPEQQTARTVLLASLEEGAFSPFLLHGVTGSGKTEVYMQAAEAALARGRGVLVLVPEIALTPQLVGRFRSRFGHRVALLHSALTSRERMRSWQQLARGDVRLAVGVRSAIFAPVRDLGLIVVDEEHDPSFKQDRALPYNARDLAVVRARNCGATVVLGSATPSLETLENVRRERYRLLELRRRVDDRPMPRLELVDLRQVRPRSAHDSGGEPPILSAPLLTAMEQTLQRGQQVILFLNRRGHSAFLVCQTCGEAVRCRNCDVSLTHHLARQRLVCHYCGDHRPVPNGCDACRGPLLALGVGTERVEAEVAERFPSARVARLDRDAITSDHRLTELLSAFARREIDVLVGTQMVAKGHDFPGVTLVCVVLADTSLSLPDFRAAERTFHLLTQVAGRAGRGQEPGRVLVQTYHPDAAPIQRTLAGDYAGFAEEELSWRQRLAWPPFTRLAAIRIEDRDPDRTVRAARLLGERVAQVLPPARMGVRVLGPAPAPLARLQGLTRWQMLIKAPTHAVLQPVLAALEAALDELPSSVRVAIDVDPGAML
ncbi:MAG TPA: primosomal protein N' [Myxococcaceae bacterium]|nr:primosomal protein N' [Myxococcaceae bacterium]